MGQTIKKLFQTEKQVKLIMLGQYSVGKTTILKQLKLGKIEVGTPTLGLEVEIFQNKNIEILNLDTSHNVYWVIFPIYCREKDGLIFVIDSMDRSQLNKTQEIFAQLMKYKEFKHVPILLLLNKSDKGVVSADEIVQLLELHQLKQQWKIQSCSALANEGIYDGLEWIIKTVQLPKMNE